MVCGWNCGALRCDQAEILGVFRISFDIDVFSPTLGSFMFVLLNIFLYFCLNFYYSSLNQ